MYWLDVWWVVMEIVTGLVWRYNRFSSWFISVDCQTKLPKLQLLTHSAWFIPATHPPSSSQLNTFPSHLLPRMHMMFVKRRSVWKLLGAGWNGVNCKRWGWGKGKKLGGKMRLWKGIIWGCLRGMCELQSGFWVDFVRCKPLLLLNWDVSCKSCSYHYLTRTLPTDLARSSPNNQPTTLPHDSRFLSIMTILPFPLFRACIEDPILRFSTSTESDDQERFAYAKRAVLARKKRNAALQAKQNVNGGGQRVQGPIPTENVVLKIGGGSESRVHITRKTTQRALWKVAKDE